MTLRIEPDRIEEVARELYVRALKHLPPDIKRGFAALAGRETRGTARSVLDVMVRNIEVAEATDNLLCQDTGLPIYNVTIGRGVAIDGVALKAALREGCARATREHPLRSSVVHPLTRHNEHTSCGPGIPVIHIDFSDAFEGLRIEMIPKGSGSENNSWLKMAIPAEGIDAIKRFVVDCSAPVSSYDAAPLIEPISPKLPGSSSASMRSRTVMRPALCCRATLSGPPISRAMAWRRRSSSSSGSQLITLLAWLRCRCRPYILAGWTPTPCFPRAATASSAI